jgi:hypothetical protein
VVGDWVGTLVGVYIVLASIRHGLPKSTITRMVFNVGVDFLLGSFPLVGDAVDFAWKSNSKNLRLLNQYAKGKGGSVWSDWLWVFILLRHSIPAWRGPYRAGVLCNQASRFQTLLTLSGELTSRL